MTIKLYFLQASRSIRTAWQLEELGLDYEVEFSPRENKVAPQAFRQKAGDLGKFPTLVDEGVSYYESGNIAEYLEEKYDTQHKLLSTDLKTKYQTLRWVHASEGMYMLHALPLIYVRWFGEGHSDAQKQMTVGMSRNVVADLNHLEKVLGESGGKYIMGDTLTVADIMMHVSVSFTLARKAGTEGHDWPKIDAWLAACEDTEGYKRAVKKTGYDLSQSG